MIHKSNLYTFVQKTDLLKNAVEKKNDKILRKKNDDIFFIVNPIKGTVVNWECKLFQQIPNVSESDYEQCNQ